MSKISNRSTDRGYKTVGDHQKYLSRITKTLYYGKLPKNDSLSLPVTELAAELFSEAQRGKSIRRLHCYDAAKISRNACVSPCSLVLAMLYLERLKKCNPDYLERTAPSELFLVSLMVSSKFLFDDGESDEVYIDEWAASGGVTVKELIAMEREFLKAIDWNIYVGELKFWKKLNEIETTLADKQGKSRGFFTYTELELLLDAFELYNFIQCVIALSVILAATYTVGILSLAGSVFLSSQVPGTALYSRTYQETHALNDKTMNDHVYEYSYNETDETEVCKHKSLDAVDVFKTGLLLATISCDNSIKASDDNNSQTVSWDWWSVPAMNWLVSTSDYIEQFELPLRYFPSFQENYPLKMKQFKIEDRLIKATKTRIQDQIENSWHEEWTDTIKYGLFYNRILPSLVYTVKS